MIVRLNQIDPRTAERDSGWAERGVAAPPASAWPNETRVLELLILDTDEKSQPLAHSFRQAQIRHLLPDILAALRPPGHEIVLRLDGPLIDGELLEAFSHLTDVHGQGRFAFSGVGKFDDQPPAALGSVRLHLPAHRLETLCNAAALGLERAVRLWGFVLTPGQVNPFLDIGDMEDERWPEILAEASAAISTLPDLRSIHLITSRFAPEDVKKRLLQRIVRRAPAVD